MRGMILAAGRGGRMGALTDDIPKPLLKVRGRYLIEYAIDSLIRAGISDIVINVSWHADQIRTVLGMGGQYGARFHFSAEPEALETGGGILNALPLLGDMPFIVISADIILEHPFAEMPACPEKGAHILLVKNPHYHPQGDFSLNGSNVLMPEGRHTLTYASAGIFSPGLFADCRPGKFRLGPLMQEAVRQGKVTGEMCRGRWWNVGTPEELAAANGY